MGRRANIGWSGATLIVAALVATAPSPGAAAREDGGNGLGGLIDRALREGGPLFTPAERALVERRCGYAPGSWNGFDIQFSQGVLVCSNGRQVDDPEVRAMMEQASPRVERRVEAVMARPEIRAAISRVAREAAARAVRDLAAAPHAD